VLPLLLQVELPLPLLEVPHLLKKRRKRRRRKRRRNRMKMYFPVINNKIDIVFRWVLVCLIRIVLRLTADGGLKCVTIPLAGSI
jgi:hypothetical protein